MKYYLYILFSEKSGIYYVGYTSNFPNRLTQHNLTSEDSFTSKHRPWEAKALFQVGDNEGDAMRIEKFIKK